MHLQTPLLVPHEDLDFEPWICADELPWEEPWGDATSLFESIEPLVILERMPSKAELLAIETEEGFEPEAFEFDEY